MNIMRSFEHEQEECVESGEEPLGQSEQTPSLVQYWFPEQIVVSERQVTGLEGEGVEAVKVRYCQ